MLDYSTRLMRTLRRLGCLLSRFDPRRWRPGRN
jgi:hypothetical protein